MERLTNRIEESEKRTRDILTTSMTLIVKAETIVS